MRHSEQFIKSERVELDHQKFIACDFTDCTMVFHGCGGTDLAGNTFNNCSWEFGGAAACTINFLRQLYHGGGRELVEQTLAQITAPLTDDEREGRT